MIEAIGILVLIANFLLIALHYRGYRVEQKLEAVLTRRKKKAP